MKTRTDVNHFLFLSAYLLGMVDAILLGLSTYGDLPHMGFISWGLRGAAVALILIKLFLDSRYSVFSLAYMGIAGVLLLLSYALSRYNHLIYLLLIVLGAKNIRVRSVIQADFIARILLVVVIVGSGLLGITENYATYRTGSMDIRYSVGFIHPNTLASMVFLLILEEAWLHKRRFSLLYMLVIWAISALIYLVTINRTAVLLMIMFPLMLLVIIGSKSRNRVSDRLRLAAQWLFPVGVVLCYIAMELCGGGGLFALVDKLMSWRFTNCKVLFDHYGIAPLGQYVDLSSGDLGRYFQIYVALLDVAFLRTLLQAGPVVLALMGWMHIRAVGDAAREHDRYTILMLCVFMAFGVSESLYNNVYMNFSLLFGARAVFTPLEANRFCLKKLRENR